VIFRATLELHGKSATGLEVPAEVVEGLGAGRRPAVAVTINGFSYRSTVASMGGRFMLPVSGERREAAGVAAGDELEVEIVVDDQPRDVEVPADLAAALAAAPGATEAFAALAPSHRKEHVRSVEEAKKPETRRRRVTRVVERVTGG
jgi:VIT1/CCC1 family predicted Fe2+/Mn2+ transporter